MKKINILLACALLVCSCEGLLTRKPKDALMPETFFTTELGCEMFTNEFYTLLPGTGIYDEEVDYIIPIVLSESVRGERKVPQTESAWNFEKLRDINYFLANSHQCEDPGVRAQYEGVARFFRAYFYYTKVRRYGDVPWVDRPLEHDSPELYKGRDSREFVMQKILEDIDFAIDNLSDKRDVSRVTKWTALALKSRIFLFEGTFRKYHAQAHPDEEYFAEEYWRKYLQEAADAAEIFISKSGYKLYNPGGQDYKDLFIQTDSDETEVVLTRRYGGGNLKIYHNVNMRYTSATQGTPGLTKDVVNSYLMSDGSRFTDVPSYETMSFEDECLGWDGRDAVSKTYKGRDPRLAQTIRTPGYTREGSTTKLAPDMSATMTGYQIIKYVGETKYDAFEKSENDLPVIRTAEVYLNYAEAKAELGTLTQADLDATINKLRTRAGLNVSLYLDAANREPDSYLMNAETGYPNVAVVNSGNVGVILEIRRERTIELIAEGHRYYDIMRWREGKRFERPFHGIYLEGVGSYDLDGDGKTDFHVYPDDEEPKDKLAGVVYKSLGSLNLSEGSEGYITCHPNEGVNKRTWNEDRDYLYPVPTNDIYLTGGAIGQNPGW